MTTPARRFSPAVTASIDNGPAVPAELTMEREQIEVTSATATRPDPSWEHVDQRGHFHAYDQDGHLPTLRVRIENVPCPGGCDDPGCEGYTVEHFHCLICDEEIEPRRVPDYGPKFVAGPTSWTVEVPQQVTAQRVSVRLTTGQPADLVEMFGVAAPGAVHAEGGPDGVRVRTILHGVGPLGQRKRAARRTVSP